MLETFSPALPAHICNMYAQPHHTTSKKGYCTPLAVEYSASKVTSNRCMHMHISYELLLPTEVCDFISSTISGGAYLQTLLSTLSMRLAGDEGALFDQCSVMVTGDSAWRRSGVLQHIGNSPGLMKFLIVES